MIPALCRQLKEHDPVRSQVAVNQPITGAGLDPAFFLSPHGVLSRSRRRVAAGPLKGRSTGEKITSRVRSHRPNLVAKARPVSRFPVRSAAVVILLVPKDSPARGGRRGVGLGAT